MAALLGVAVTTAAQEPSPAVMVVTEDFPPFQYYENGRLVGPALDVVTEALAGAGLSATIRVLPWARAMKIAEHEANVLIFTIARTPERETRFKWVGTLTDGFRVRMYGASGRNIAAASLDQAKGLVVGTAINDAFTEYLQRRGFEVGHNLVLFRDYASGFAMLKAGRIDMLPLGDGSYFYFYHHPAAGSVEEMVPLFPLDFTSQEFTGDFMAFSRQTDDQLVARLAASLDAMKSDGRYEAIQRRWGR